MSLETVRFAWVSERAANGHGIAQADSYMKTLKVEEVDRAGYDRLDAVVSCLPRFIAKG